MIIWGSKAKRKQIGTGTFYCPQCRKESPYAHIRLSRYFTLYFIPLFPTKTLGEAVRCLSCFGEFTPGVLSLSAEKIELLCSPGPAPNAATEMRVRSRSVCHVE